MHGYRSTLLGAVSRAAVACQGFGGPPIMLWTQDLRRINQRVADALEPVAPHCGNYIAEVARESASANDCEDLRGFLGLSISASVSSGPGRVHPADAHHPRERPHRRGRRTAAAPCNRPRSCLRPRLGGRSAAVVRRKRPPAVRRPGRSRTVQVIGESCWACRSVARRMRVAQLKKAGSDRAGKPTSPYPRLHGGSCPWAWCRSAVMAQAQGLGLDQAAAMLRGLAA